MNMKITAKLFLLVILASVVAGCGNKPEPTPTIDPVAVMTDVAGTVQAEVTQNALLTPSATIPPPPTATLPAIPTQALPPMPTTSTAPALPPGQSPDNSEFIADIDVQDGDVFWKGERFTKTWQIKNTGTTTWDTTYRFVYLEGDILSEELVFNLVSPVKPGELLNIGVKMTAPETLGTFKNYWKMMNADGQFFGQVVSTEIVVGTIYDKTATPAG